MQKIQGKRLFEFPVLYSGWECDSQAWVIELADGSRAIVMTSHGQEYIAKPSEVGEKIKEYRDAIAASRKALRLLSGEAE